VGGEEELGRGTERKRGWSFREALTSRRRETVCQGDITTHRCGRRYHWSGQSFAVRRKAFLSLFPLPRPHFFLVFDPDSLRPVRGATLPKRQGWPVPSLSSPTAVFSLKQAGDRPPQPTRKSRVAAAHDLYLASTLVSRQLNLTVDDIVGVVR
jgi:hypothetical protein